MRSRGYLSAVVALATAAVGVSIIIASSSRADEPGGLTEQDAGRAIYQARCETCHGPHGRGTKGYEIPATGPALQGNPLIVNAPATIIAQVIRNGRTGARRVYDDTYADMPSFDGSRIPDLRPLIAYMKGEMQQGK